MESEQFYILLRMDTFLSYQDKWLVAGASVLTSGGPIVVGTVAGA